ncbi:hypothetical protein SLEP1_g48222 [Rubroshorea leprosula]|uniref:Uncharacterized protein n=1 Tax=Rubroshorea leprosula TaxID=152421 RepID=A0AAV5LVZ1_9ROSI|nr:hypothetical protein SLEP1_g48222 [Rubroshorea leprosula]
MKMMRSEMIGMVVGSKSGPGVTVGEKMTSRTTVFFFVATALLFL